jgi:hypothetical protein
MMNSVILHNPGCGNPDEICSPHPMGLAEMLQAYQNNPELLVVPAIIIVAVSAVGLYRRWDIQQAT